MEKPENIGKAVLTEDGSYMIELDKKKRIQVRTFRGMTLIDIREFYKTTNNEFKPGKKGISLNLEAWKRLKDSIADIDSCIDEMKTNSK
ncbi:putative RNA polymerase II transcriptional coactivator [Neocallimastix lanati (nom. inval.)]|uniref:Putative RNA polymerase II transcriptional coactivator n=1 Tax=Neocallimastix californiae TaxID=1754190 RepID=A0A1Y2D933_9FUNG|nr:putative RNA polymerase II transcriptional coactivator [Neocallimastix sp. JGI-2020a]ORY55780.1 putative RNA polymerase II transcriptional coactivator [Neocallimastix californiae]|eukprot:ORY55780.1 putative RNA polymerase II transcriptional coactivator [Neocallimastix californiae]